MGTGSSPPLGGFLRCGGAALREAPGCPATGRKVLVYCHLKGASVVSMSGL